MNDPAACFVCRKQRGEVDVPGGALFSDELVYVSHGAMDRDATTYPGVLFVEPRRHAAGPADLTRAEAEQIGWIQTLACRALRDEGADRVYVATLGHHVAHLHVWLIPRWPGIPPEYFGYRVLEFPDGPRESWEEVERRCARIGRSLRNGFLVDD